MLKFLNNNFPILAIISCFAGFILLIIALVIMDMNNKNSQYTSCLDRGMQYISGNCLK